MQDKESENSTNQYKNDGIMAKDYTDDGHALGYIGYDGCWYPNEKSAIAYQDMKMKSKSLSLGSNGGENEDGVGLLVPPSRCTMPKPLMALYNFYQRLDLPMSALGRPQLIHTYSSNDKLGVDHLWTAHKKLLFRNFMHDWSLSPATASRLLDSSFFRFRDVAKVRFFCEHCMDGWTSMCGVVIFYYKLNESKNRGEIYYHIAGQKCGHCNPDVFEMPLWYPEEAQKVITNLYYDIAARVYGLQTPLPIKTRRLGQPINQHNNYLCQGCYQGVCKQDQQQKRCACTTGPLIEGLQQMSPSHPFIPSQSSAIASDLVNSHLPYIVSPYPYSDCGTAMGNSIPYSFPSMLSSYNNASYFECIPPIALHYSVIAC